MRAVILAAGLGNRLREINPDNPKPLFEINGKSLLQYSLESLAKSEIERADIVIGFQGDKIRSKFGSRFRGITLNYPENRHYASTGSMHSLMHSLWSAMPTEDSVVLDGDLVYSPEIISRMLGDKRDLAFLAESKGDREETYAVLDDTGRIVYFAVNQRLPEAMRNRKVFEFNGISKFSKEFLSRMFVAYLNCGNERAYYEEYAFNSGNPWHGIFDSSLALAEVDKPCDIEKARRVIEQLNL